MPSATPVLKPVARKRTAEMAIERQTPADLVELGRRLRKLLVAYDNAALLLDGDLARLEPTLTGDAALRAALHATAGQVYAFLGQLESTPAYRQVVRGGG